MELPANLPKWAPFAAVGAVAGVFVLVRNAGHNAPVAVTAATPVPDKTPVYLPEGASAGGGGGVQLDYGAIMNDALSKEDAAWQKQFADQATANSTAFGAITKTLNDFINKSNVTTPVAPSPQPVAPEPKPTPVTPVNVIPTPTPITPAPIGPITPWVPIYQPPASSPIAPVPAPVPITTAVKGPAYVANGFLFASGEVLPTYAFTSITTRRGTTVRLPSMYEPNKDTHQYWNSGHPESAMGKVQRMLSDLQEGGRVWSGQPNNDPTDARNVYGVMHVVIGEAGGLNTGFVHADRFV